MSLSSRLSPQVRHAQPPWLLLELTLLFLCDAESQPTAVRHEVLSGQEDPHRPSFKHLCDRTEGLLPRGMVGGQLRSPSTTLQPHSEGEHGVPGPACRPIPAEPQRPPLLRPGASQRGQAGGWSPCQDVLPT